MPSNNTVIQVTNLEKIFKIYEKPMDRLLEIFTGKKKHNQVVALHDISFEVKRGQTVGIIGRNGAGKSTILQIIAGTLTPSNGNIVVNGRVVALLELGAGFNMEYTGEENIYLYAAILGLTKDEIKMKYNEIIQFAEIGEFINYPVKTYSSGMFVRLAFAVAINVNPEILIIDEALSVGDVQFQHKCMAKLRDLQKSGCTILFVSHDIDSVKSLCDSAILLSKGQLKLTGTPEEVSNAYMELIHLEQLEKRQLEPKVMKGEKKYYSDNKELDWEEENFLDADRHGKQEAKIIRVTYKDKNNIETQHIQFGEALHVSILIEYKKDIKTEINVGFLLRDEKGVDILGDDSWNHNILLPSGQAGSRLVIEFAFPNLYLKPGSYMSTIALGAMSAERTTWNDYYYDWIDRAKLLNIRMPEKLRIWSKVLLPSKVKLERFTPEEQ